MTVRGAAFLGIGAMVGAGIFALLGEAGAVAGAAVWLSFLLAGIVAGLLGYTVVHLGVRFPSSGGLIAYLREGFGNGHLVGVASWLGYFAAIVIVCSMVAVAFGSYASSLFIGSDAASAWDNVFTSAIVLAMLAINIVGSRVVDRAQSLIVVVLLAVFAVFIAVTLVDVDWDLLAFGGYPSVADIVASVALTFFAYLGFSVITFAGRRPARSRARAAEGHVRSTWDHERHIRADLGGRLRNPDGRRGDRLRRDGDRRGGSTDPRRLRVRDDGRCGAPGHGVLGERDPVRLRGLDGVLASIGQFPPIFGRDSRLGSHAGLLITSALVLVVGNLIDLSAIASVGSACSVAIFLLVGLAGYRLRAETGSNAAIVLAAIGVTAIVLVFFAVDTLRNAPETFTAIVAIGALSAALDLLWKRSRRAGAPASTAGH